MTTLALQPDREALDTELTAVEAGYGPLATDVSEHLGRFSLAASQIEEAMDTASQERINAQFVSEFVSSLPHSKQPGYAEYDFYLEGDDVQYTARTLQANVLWSNYVPYYIVGRAVDPKDDTLEKLLLASSDGSGRLRTESVLRSDMKLRDEIVEDMEEKEFDSEQIRLATVRNKGQFELTSRTDGSLHTDGGEAMPGIFGTRKNSSKEKILRRGLKTEWSRTIRSIDSLSSDDIRDLQVGNYLAKLAVAFGKVDQLRDLLKGEPESLEAQPSLDEALEQNEQLRSALRDLMMASGLVKPEEIDRILEERFPTLGKPKKI